MSPLVELFSAEDLDMLEGLVDARLLTIARWANETHTFLSTLAHQACPSIDDPSICVCGLAALLSQVRAPAPTKDGEQ